MTSHEMETALTELASTFERLASDQVSKTSVMLKQAARLINGNATPEDAALDRNVLAGKLEALADSYEGVLSPHGAEKVVMLRAAAITIGGKAL